MIREAAPPSHDRRLTNEAIYCGTVWLVTTGAGAIAGAVVGVLVGHTTESVLWGVTAGTLAAALVLWREWDR